MDKEIRDKNVEGGSSDEEEVFESVDEGEDGIKYGKYFICVVVMLVDIRFLYFMLKELVGMNDVLIIRQVILDGDISFEKEELEM